MIEYIVFWKDAPGQQVSTVVDPENQPVIRDAEYVETNDIFVLKDKDDVLNALTNANGVRYAITRELARETLGWDV